MNCAILNRTVLTAYKPFVFDLATTQARNFTRCLVILLYLASILLYLSGLLNGIIILMLSGFALLQPLKLLSAPHGERKRLTSLTGRFYFIYSSVFIATTWLLLP